MAGVCLVIYTIPGLGQLKLKHQTPPFVIINTLNLLLNQNTKPYPNPIPLSQIHSHHGSLQSHLLDTPQSPLQPSPPPSFLRLPPPHFILLPGGGRRGAPPPQAPAPHGTSPLRPKPYPNRAEAPILTLLPKP